MGRKFIIQIQSISDIITNSSSEVFVINTSENLVESVVEEILRVGETHLESGEDRCSGMGGELMVYTWENGFRKFKHTREKYRHDSTFAPERWAEEIGVPLQTLKSTIVVDIDYSRQATINFIKMFFNVTGEDEYYEPENGKFIDFIDGYTDYSDEAPYNEDLDTFDNEAWQLEYIEALRNAGYAEKDIQEFLKGNE